MRTWHEVRNFAWHPGGLCLWKGNIVLPEMLIL